MAEQGSTTAQAATEAKGKYKAENPPQDVSMDEGEGDDSSDEETGAEEEPPEEPEEEDLDNMEEIDPQNIMNERTRGKQIDFAEADANAEDLDEDEEDDEDFVAKEDDEMRG